MLMEIFKKHHNWFNFCTENFSLRIKNITWWRMQCQLYPYELSRISSFGWQMMLLRNFIAQVSACSLEDLLSHCFEKGCKTVLGSLEKTQCLLEEDMTLKYEAVKACHLQGCNMHQCSERESSYDATVVMCAYCISLVWKATTTLYFDKG